MMLPVVQEKKYQMEEISSYLLVLVKNSGRKQRDIATQAGINPVYLNRWIKGNRPLSAENLQKVAKAMQVDITNMSIKLPQPPETETGRMTAELEQWKERAMKAEAKLAHLERACAALGQHVSALGITVENFSKIISS